METEGFIPTELKNQPRWMVWKLVPSTSRPGKFRKVPYDAKTGRLASSNDSTTWSSFDIALTAFRTGAYDGVGFQLGGGFAGVDLDDCIAAATRHVADWALEIVDRLKTYTEMSPSGLGLKCFLKGKLPSGPRRQDLPNGRVEFYDGRQFFNVTGQRFEEISVIRECDRDLNAVYNYCGQSKPPEKKPSPSKSLDDAVEGLVRKIRDLPRGSPLKRLFFEGNWHGRYPSASEADLGLCLMLALRFGTDFRMVDSLVRRSALFRGKWDEVHTGSGRAYGQRTVALAVSKAQSEFRARWGVRTHSELSMRVQAQEEVGYVVEGIVPARSLVLLAGESGLGKSPLLYQLSLSVASGIPFLGNAVTCGRVLYLDFENGSGEVEDVVDRLGSYLRLPRIPQEYLCFWNFNDAHDGRDQIARKMKEMIGDLKPKLTGCRFFERVCAPN